MLEGGLTTRKLYAWLLILLTSVTGLTILSPTTESQAQTTTLRVTSMDYTTPVTAFFGNGAAFVVLTSAASDRTDQRDLITGVTATVGTDASTRILFDLLETGPRTGVFTGSFTVGAAKADAIEDPVYPEFGRTRGDGRIVALSGNTINIASTTPAATTSVKWFPASTGVFTDHEDAAHNVAQGPEIVGYLDIVHYLLTNEQDLNRDPTRVETHTGLLRVWSDSDPTGELIPLVETGVNSPDFTASVGFERTLTPNNRLVMVRHTDRVFAQYTDFQDENGFPRSTRIVGTFMDASDAVVGFDRTSYSGFTQLNPNGFDRATVLVFDPDLDNAIGSETVRVTVKRDGTVVCQALLTQLGDVLSGTYHVTFGFGPATSTCSAPPLDAPFDVATGAVILPTTPLGRHVFSVEYEDERTRAGPSETRTASFQWVQAADASLVLGPDFANPVSRFVGTTAPLNVRVLDPDSDLDPNARDTLFVVLKSSTDGSGGLSVALLESGPGSGDFSGSVRFTEVGPSGNGFLAVKDGDVVVALYKDPVGTNGLPREVRSQEMVWRRAVTGVVESDAPEYFYSLPGGPHIGFRFLDADGDSVDPDQDVATIFADLDRDETFSYGRDAFIEFRDAQGNPAKAEVLEEEQAMPGARTQVVIDRDGLLGLDHPSRTYPLVDANGLPTVGNPLEVLTAAGSDAESAVDAATVLVDLNNDGSIGGATERILQTRNNLDEVVRVGDPARTRLLLDDDGQGGANLETLLTWIQVRTAMPIPLAFLDTAGAFTTTKASIATIVADTNRDNRFDAAPERVFQFRNDAGTPVAVSAATHVSVLGGASQPFKGMTNGLSIRDATGGTVEPPHPRLTATVIVDTNQEDGVLSTATDAFLQFQSSNGVAVTSPAPSRYRLVVDGDGNSGGAGATTIPLIAGDNYVSLRNFLGVETAVLADIAAIVVDTNADCRLDPATDAFLQFQTATGSAIAHGSAAKAVLDRDGTNGPQAQETITLGVASTIVFDMGDLPTAAGALRAVTVDPDGAGALAPAFLRFEAAGDVVVAAMAGTRAELVLQGLPGGLALTSLPLRTRPCPQAEARVFVEDMDQNDPRVRDRISVQVVTLNAPGVPTDAVTLEMDEVGVNSGLFTATLRLFDSPPEGPNVPTALEVGVGNMQQFRIEYLDPISADGAPRLASSPTLTWRKVLPGSSEVFVRTEIDQGGVIRSRNIFDLNTRSAPITGPAGGGCCNVRDSLLTSVYKDPLSTSNAIISVSSSKCPEIKQFTLTDLRDSGSTTTAVGDGRFSGFIATATSNNNPSDPCQGTTATGNTVLNSLADRLAVTRPGTITVRAAPGIETTASVRVRANPSTVLTNIDPTLILGPGARSATGETLPIHIRTTAPNDNFMVGHRSVVTVTAFSNRDPVGFPVVLAETGPDTNVFAGSLVHQEVPASNPAGLVLAVQSDLPGGFAFHPASNQQLPRTNDGVTVTGKGTAKSAWFDGDTAALEISPAWFGGSGVFPVTLSGEDVQAGRIRGERLVSTATTQRTFVLSRPYVGGSEYVYRAGFVQGTQANADPNAPLEYQVTVPEAMGTPAGEPIWDRTANGFTDCGDVTFAPSSETLDFDCIRVDGAAGTIRYFCIGCSNVDMGYEFRLGFEPSPAPSVRRYSRPSENQIQLGANAGGPTGQVWFVDYTPKFQTLVVTSSAGEVERITVGWDEATRTFRGSIPVETVRMANNGKIFVAGPQTQITVRYDDQNLHDGFASSTDPNHFRAVVARAVWRPGQDAAVTFHNGDYTQRFTDRVFGPAVAVQIVDTDSDRNPLQDVIVARASDGGNAANALSFVLRETGPRTGVFRGFVPMGAAPALNLGPTGGQLVVRYNDPFTAIGSPGFAAGSVAWQPAETASFKLYRGARIDANELASPTPQNPQGNVVSGADARLLIDVMDKDANVNRGVVDRVHVRVTSPFDPVGEVFELVETGPDTGVFESAFVRFEPTLVPNNGRVFARDFGSGPTLVRDDIRVEYEDLLTLEGRRAVVSPAFPVKWDQSFDGVVDVESSVYVGTVQDKAAGLSGLNHLAMIDVHDGDCNLNPNVVDVIGVLPSPDGACPASTAFKFLVSASSAGTLPLPISGFPLVETGANTGVFRASVGFTTGDSGTSPPLLKVANGDRVRGAYTDPFHAASTSVSGLVREFVDEADWFAHGFGVVVFDLPGYNALGQKAEITVLDGDKDTTASADKLRVRVISDADGTGIEVDATETGGRTGIFKVLVTLTDGASSASGEPKIKVATIDELRARYTDENPTGIRIAIAAVRIGDLTPPVTTLVTDPEEADGLRGVFITRPKVSFETSEPVLKTQFRMGAGALAEWNGIPIELGEGSHEIKFFSTDTVGNVEADSNVTLEVDLTDPTATVSGVAGQPAANGAVRINWTGIVGSTSPFDFFEYSVYRDLQLQSPVGNTTDLNLTDTSVADENPHSYQVAVRDKSGRRGPLSAQVTVQPDRTKPSLSNPVVDPATFDVRQNLTSMNVSVVATDLNLQSVRADIVAPGNQTLAGSPLTAGAGPLFSGTIPLANITQPCTCVVRFNATDSAGNVATLDVPLLITGEDSQPPQVQFLNLNDDKLALGLDLEVEVTDNVALGAIGYRLNRGIAVTVPVAPGNTTIRFQVPTSPLPLGLHVVQVNAEDRAVDTQGQPAPNRISVEQNFTVVPAPVEQPPSAGGNFFLPTRATILPNGSVMVEWDLPAGSQALGIVGVQIWRASSPFALVAYVNDTSQRSFVDGGAIAGRAYRYVVTYFTGATGPFAALSQVPGFPGSDEQVSGSNTVSVPGEEGVPAWVWVVVSALAIMAIAVLIAVVLVSRRSSTEQVLVQAPPPEPAPEEAPAIEPGAPALEERHRIRCPECDHRFEATGTKPIVTTCPNCGRKGILR